MRTVPSVLSIAGSDPSGGAGIQADLKTFAALGVYGMAAITALTAQNTVAVTGVHEVPPDFIAQQIDAVFADIVPDSVKTGMLGSAAVVRVVAEKARQHSFRNLVVDPVMVAKSGDRLLREDAAKAVREELIPFAFVVTPNLPEAAEIVGFDVATLDDMREAARAIHALGARNVVVKGGHLAGDVVTDLLYDGETFHDFSGPRVNTKNTHGTGCTFASAIACYLAKDATILDAVCEARAYLTGALENAYDTGEGHGSVNHMWVLDR
jgi:hydroxymethylpyrimidine/phosphomethylpyrimidine kinase